MFNLVTRFWNRGKPKPAEHLKRLSDSSPLHMLPQRFRIATWNMYKQRGDGYYQDFADLWDKCDILAGQEYWLKHSFLGVNASTFFGANFSYKGHFTGQVTISKADTELAIAYHSNHAEAFLGSHKGMLVTSYKIDGRKDNLLVINIHGLLTRSTKQWQQLVDWGFFVASFHKGPVVYLGDFNTKNAERSELLDRLATKNDFWRTHALGQAKFDAVLTRGLEITSYKALNYESSNHPAILLEVEPY